MLGFDRMYEVCRRGAQQVIEDAAKEPEPSNEDLLKTEIERLQHALIGLAMRKIKLDSSWCWCDGPLVNEATHEHEPECLEARHAMGY